TRHRRDRGKQGEAGKSGYRGRPQGFSPGAAAHGGQARAKRLVWKSRRATSGPGSDVADLDDLVAARAARGGDLERIALLLADHGAGDGRGNRDAPGRSV